MFIEFLNKNLKIQIRNKGKKGLTNNRKNYCLKEHLKHISCVERILWSVLCGSHRNFIVSYNVISALLYVHIKSYVKALLDE